jgi:hypothetical protein
MCLSSAPPIVQVVSNFPENLQDFVNQHCAQYVLLGLQIMWTADVEAAFDGMRKKKGGGLMRDVATKTANILKILSSWCLQEMPSPMNRCVCCAVNSVGCAVALRILFART